MTNQKFYYAISGQPETTCHNANAITGQYSRYVDLHVFKSASDRDDFISDYTGLDKCFAVKRSEIREYFLGMTVEEFTEMIDYEKQALEISEGC